MMDTMLLLVIFFAVFAFRVSCATNIDFKPGFGQNLSCETKRFLAPYESCDPDSNMCAYDDFCSNGPYPNCRPCDQETACKAEHIAKDNTALTCFDLCPFYYSRHIFGKLLLMYCALKT